MKNTTRMIAAAAGVLTIISGCAKDPSTSAGDTALRYVEAWLSANHPGVKASGNGIYVLSDEAGTGDVAGDDMYVYVDYTITDLDGNVTSTTSRRLARQVGSGYSDNNYYGPKIWANTAGSTYAGVAQLLSGMKVGGTRSALIPSWLLTSARYDDSSKYLAEAASDVANSIYTVTLRDVIKDVTQWQIDSIASYIPGAIGQSVTDSLSFGFYYKSIVETGSGSEFPSDTTVYVNYVGRLLDGTVFDTNVADSAKFYGLYSAAKTYSPMKITWGETSSDLKISSTSSSGTTSESTPVTGFQLMLWEMGPYEKGTGVFYSDLGYQYQGSGNSIPPFSPLRFDIELVDSE